MSDDRDPTVEAAVSGKAWEDVCDGIKAAGQLVVDNSADDLDRLEGFRYLARLTRGALDSYLEQGDTSFPVIAPIPNMLKIGCDNPDAYYQRVNVSGRHTYRITGSRGTVNYLGLGAYSGGYGTGDATPGNEGYLEFNDPGPGQRIDVIASTEEPTLGAGQRWLPMQEHTGILMVRQFHLDRTSETRAELTIECLDPVTPVPDNIDARRLVNGLAMSQLFVHGCAQRFIDWVQKDFLLRPNTLDFLPPSDHAGGWGDPNQLFRHGYWTLDEGEALLIDVPAIDAYYWNFQLNNLWEESLDYRFLQVTVNQHSARYEDDGSARIVVAPEDPGVGNWMDTAGHRHGTMGLRYNQVVEDIPPTVRVVPLAELV